MTLVHVAGGGQAQIQLFDQIANRARVGTGTVAGSFKVVAEWGPYSAATGVVEITNEYDQYWFFGGGCQPSSTSSGGIFTNRSCPSLNSTTSVNVPVIVGDGDALLLFLQANPSSYGDGSIEVSDPLTVMLPPGTTFTDSILPVAYSQPTAVPEPPTLWLMGAGLLGLGWTVRRRTGAALGGQLTPSA